MAGRDVAGRDAVGGRYRFRHALYPEAVYAAISPERRARFHRLIGDRLEIERRQARGLNDRRRARHALRTGARPLTKPCRVPGAGRGGTRCTAPPTPKHEGHLLRALKMVESLPGQPRAPSAAKPSLSLLLAQVLETTKGWGAEDVARRTPGHGNCAVALDDEPQSAPGDVGSGRRDRCSGRAAEDAGAHPARCSVVATKTARCRLFRMAAHAELGGTALTLGQTTVGQEDISELAEALSPSCAT